jgi:cell division protein FtsZ
MSGIMQVTDGSQQEMVVPSDNGVVAIKVVGVGGGGGNTVQHMIDEKIKNVEFIVVNTDLQALNSNLAEKRIQIGVNTTRGLGSGSNPDVGRAAAEESRDDLKNAIGKSDIVFVTAGMGGGTGTGASPIVSQIARNDLNALTVAIVTKPFSFEGKKQLSKAEAGIAKLRDVVDALIVIPNDKLLRDLPKNISLINAFNECNHVLKRAVQGLSNLITNNGYWNVDFNDVKTVLKESGTALIGMGKGTGETAVQDAIKAAIHSPLLEDVTNCHVKGMLANISIGPEFQISQLNELGDILQSHVTDDTDVKFGICYDSTLKNDEVNATILLAGLSPINSAERKPMLSSVKENLSTATSKTESLFGSLKSVEDTKTEDEVPLLKSKSPFDDGDELPSFLTKKAD